MTNPADVVPEVYVETADVDPDAAAVFGPELVDEAVAELTELAVAEAFPPELLDPQRQEFSRDDFLGEAVIERFTPEAAQGWETLVDAALDGDQEAKDAVRAMRFYDIEEPAWTLPGDDPVVMSQQITDVQVEVDATGGAGQELLVVSFDHDATLAFNQGTEPVGLEIAKEMTYDLTPATAEDTTAEEGPSWLIADFGGQFEVSTSS